MTSREHGSLLVDRSRPARLYGHRPVKKEHGCRYKSSIFSHAEQTKPLKTVQKRTVIVARRESAYKDKRCCVLIDTSDEEEKKQLREEKKQLREEKNLLRQKENTLLQFSESTLLLNIHVA